MNKKLNSVEAVKKTNHKRRFRILQRQLTRRRIWLVAAVIFYMVMYYPVAVVMLISRANNRGTIQGFSPANMHSSRLGEVSTWLGIRQDFSWVFVVLGVIMAISGYAYLFSMDKQDFYDSQPVSKRERFWNIWANGFLVVFIPTVICLFLSIALAAAMGAMNAITFADAMIQLIRNILAFASAYSVGILAVMMTGNPIICTLVSIFFMGIEMVYAYLVRALASGFFATYCYWDDGSRIPAALLSPLYNSLKAMSAMSSGSQNLSFGPMSKAILSYLVKTVWAGDLVNLIVAAVVLVLAFRLFLIRKEEWAGSTVIFRPVSGIIRILTSVAAGFFVYLLLDAVFDYNIQNSRSGQIFMIIGMIAAVVIVSGIIRMIHELNFWRFFGRIGETAAAVAAAAIVFSAFRFDFFGYDHYVPAADKVASIAIYENGSAFSGSYADPMDATNTIPDEEHVFHKMTLTDIEAVEKITSAGMDLMRKNQEYSQASQTEAQDSASNEELAGWSADVLYRMKDGRKIYRSILIPCNTDPALLNRLVGSVAYRQGLFGVYDDDFIDSAAKTNPKKVVLYYSNGMDESYGTGKTQDSGSGEWYEEFADAYRKDLRSYDYTLASTEDVIGDLSVQGDSGDLYISSSYPVYSSFANTIAFLKKHGLYLEQPSAENLTSLSVYCYDSTTQDSTTVEYTDKEQIREILDVCENTLSSDWKDTSSNHYDLSYSVTGMDASGNEYYNLNFLAGRVPDFVKADIQKETSAEVEFSIETESEEGASDSSTTVSTP